MNLSRCENGHFYDKEKYSTCPHCAQGKNRDDSLTTIFENSGNNEIDATMPLTGQGDSQVNMGGFVGDVNPLMNNQGMPTPPNVLQGRPHTDNPMPGGGYSDETETLGRENVVPDFDIPIPVTDDNRNKVNPIQTVQDDDDSTVAYWDYEDLFSTPASPSRPQAPVAGKVSNTTSRHTSTSPCAGWVISLNGNHFGQDFRLKVGKNFVGRDSSMDIPLEGDKSVSRNKHAILVYEPKQHLYLVQPGESSELVYLNNEVVLSPMKLKAYDVITVGEVNLLFMPLCGEQFSWSDYLGKGRR